MLEPRQQLGSVPYALEAQALQGRVPEDLQVRVTGSCGAGSYAASVNADGSLNCRPTLTTTGAYSVQRNNAGGVSEVVMTSTTASICFVTSVSFEDIDAGGEWAECEVVASGGAWRLRASLGATSDSDAWCQARWIQW